MSAQRCRWMLIELRGSLLNLICVWVFAFSLLVAVSRRKKKVRHLVLSLADSRVTKVMKRPASTYISACAVNTSPPANHLVPWDAGDAFTCFGSRRGWIRVWPAGLNWHFRAEQIFLIVIVPLRMRHDLLGFATGSHHFFSRMRRDGLSCHNWIEGIYPLGGGDNKTLYFSANRYYYNNVFVIISLFFSLSHLFHWLCTVKIFHWTIDIFSKVADSLALSPGYGESV